MPLKYLIDKDRRLVTTTGRGELTFSEARALQEGVRNDADFDPSFDQLVELSEVALVAMTSVELRSIAEHNPFSRTSRIAFLAPKAVVYGLSRMLQVYTEYSPAASHAAVFYDLQSTLRFLESGVTE